MAPSPDGAVRADELVGDPRQRPILGDQPLGAVGGGTAPAVCLLARHRFYESCAEARFTSP
jgi:hypothetical protein